MRPGRLRDEVSLADYAISEADRLMNDILDALEIIGGNNSDMNHIFINFSAGAAAGRQSEVEEKLAGFLNRFGGRAWRLRVNTVEVRLVCTTPAGQPYPLRVVIINTSGFVAEIELYTERKDSNGEWMFYSIGGTAKKGSMHLCPVNKEYPTKSALQPKRYKAHLMGTQFVYDFPELVPPGHREQAGPRRPSRRPCCARSSPSAASASSTASWSSITPTNWSR